MHCSCLLLKLYMLVARSRTVRSMRNELWLKIASDRSDLSVPSGNQKMWCRPPKYDSCHHPISDCSSWCIQLRLCIVLFSAVNSRQNSFRVHFSVHKKRQNQIVIYAIGTAGNKCFVNQKSLQFDSHKRSSASSLNLRPLSINVQLLLSTIFCSKYLELFSS